MIRKNWHSLPMMMTFFTSITKNKSKIIKLNTIFKNDENQDLSLSLFRERKKPMLKTNNDLKERQ